MSGNIALETHHKKGLDGVVSYDCYNYTVVTYDANNEIHFCYMQRVKQELKTTILDHVDSWGDIFDGNIFWWRYAVCNISNC